MLSALKNAAARQAVAGKSPRAYSSNSEAQESLKRAQRPRSTKGGVYAKKIVDDYQEELIVLRKPGKGQRIANQDEMNIIQAHLTRVRDSLKRKVAVLHWAQRVPALAFVRGMKEVERRVHSSKGLSAAAAGDLMLQFQFLVSVSPYLPQSALLLALRLADALPKHSEFVEELVSRFAGHYNEYLDSVGDKHALAAFPRAFIDDVKHGMNLELLEVLVKRGNVALVSTFLSVLPIPAHTPAVLISALIDLDPVLMTTKLAGQYTPQQATLAFEKALAGRNATLLSTLIRSVPTRVYEIRHLEDLIELMRTNSLAHLYDRLVEIIAIEGLDISPPARATELEAQKNGKETIETKKLGFATLCAHFAEAQQWSTLQRLLAAKHYNTTWAEDAVLEKLINGAYQAKWRDFAFKILLALPRERIVALKANTYENWIRTSKLYGPELQTFMNNMASVLEHFKLALPADLSTSTEDKLFGASHVETDVPTAELQLDQAQAKQAEIALSPEQVKAASESAEMQKSLLIINSRQYDIENGFKWTPAQRDEHVSLIKNFQARFPDQTLGSGTWASLLMCILNEYETSSALNTGNAAPKVIGDSSASSEVSRSDALRSELNKMYRSFENAFLSKRPKLEERDRKLMSLALTGLAHFLWREGRHSAAMSVANMMAYYKLRTDRSFEVLVREQASAQNSVSGVAPLSWLSNVVASGESPSKSGAMSSLAALESEASGALADASFFNPLLGFLQASIKFDLDAALQESIALSRDATETKVVMHQANKERAQEVWKALVPIWRRAMASNWHPTSSFMSVLFKLAQLQGEPATFFLEALKYCHAHAVSLAPSDLPLLHVLTSLLESSNHTLGAYLLASNGLNMLMALPSNVATKRALTAFIMRCLAHAADHKNAITAFTLFSGSYYNNTTAQSAKQSETSTLPPSARAHAPIAHASIFTPQCHALVDAFFHVCATKKTFATAEKFTRGILHAFKRNPLLPPEEGRHNEIPLYVMAIELAGQCGELSAAVRIYHEASASLLTSNAATLSSEIGSLTHTILHAVAQCNVLPLEAQRLRVRLEASPDVSLAQQKAQTDLFLTSIPSSELTRRSRSTYISL